MDNYGFIHGKRDIKLLILYILDRLPMLVDRGTLDELCQQCDDGVGYFDYSDCLGDLIRAGLVRDEDEEYAITPKGRASAREVEDSLPYSVRAKAARLIEPARQKLARSEMIRTETVNGENGCTASLSLSDGKGEVMSLSVLCADEEMAKKVKRNFRRNAEDIYRRILAILYEEGK